MKEQTELTIFLVDDDQVFLRLLEIDFLEHTPYKVEKYATGELCLANINKKPDLVILDYHLDGIEKDVMNGIEVLDAIKIINQEIPVVMLSSQDKIQVAVNCMHHKAYDYVVKSETAFLRLQSIMSNILSFQQIEKKLNWYKDRM